MVNATEDIIMPESPNIHSQQTAVFYVQNAGEYTENAAGNDRKGVASFLRRQFIVENGKVRLRTEYLTDILNPMVQSASESAGLSSMNASDCKDYADKARVYSNASKEYATDGWGYAEQARQAAEDAVNIVNNFGTAIKKDVDYNSKRIENLEASLSDDAFISDSSVAYQKSVPSNVAPYAVVEKIGGMTYKRVLPEGNLYPYPYTLQWSGSTDVDGVWTCTNPFDELDHFDIATSAVTLPSGTYICDVGNDGAVESVEVRTSGVSIERISNTKARITASSSWTFSGVDIYVYALQTATCYPMLYLEGNPITWQPRIFELQHAKVTAIKSVGANGTLDTFTIPEVAQALEGYGLGVNENYYNYIEYANGRVNLDKRVKMGVVSKIAHVSWANYSNVDYYAFKLPTDYIGYATDAFMLEGFNKKPSHTNWDSTDFIGVATGLATEYEIWVGFAKGTTQAAAEAALLGKSFVYALAAPEIEDITDRMPSDNYIKVEGGGTIIADNEYENAVPTTITYQRRG